MADGDGPPRWLHSFRPRSSGSRRSSVKVELVCTGEVDGKGREMVEVVKEDGWARERLGREMRGRGRGRSGHLGKSKGH